MILFYIQTSPKQGVLIGFQLRSSKKRSSAKVNGFHCRPMNDCILKKLTTHRIFNQEGANLVKI